jgi:hypothetical protein
MDAPKHLYDRPALKALGINYSRQHLDRLEREKKIPRAYQRGPHCRKLYSDEHVAILLGRRPEPEAA